MLLFKTKKELEHWAPCPILKDIYYIFGGFFDLEKTIGGYVYVAQTPEDLKEVTGFNWIFSEKTNRNPNLTDPVEAFEDIRDIEGFVSFYMTTNDSGGNIYYVPESLLKYVKAKKYDS
jgi:hypothetical protein